MLHSGASLYYSNFVHSNSGIAVAIARESPVHHDFFAECFCAIFSRDTIKITPFVRACALIQIEWVHTNTRSRAAAIYVATLSNAG